MLRNSLIALLFLPMVSIMAQEPKPCATVQTEEDLAWLRAFQQKKIQYKDDGEMIWAPLKIHVVGRADGTGYFSVRSVFDMICDLNANMLVHDMQFFFDGDINYINNTNYYIHDYAAGGQMMRFSNVEGFINIYVVQDPAGACGYYTPQWDAIALRKSCSQKNSTTLTHEMGHFLSLPHTFFGWEDYSYLGDESPGSVESVYRTGPESNCASTSDGFCDTYPDYLSFRWDCPFSENLVDKRGKNFVVDPGNYMSYSDDPCHSHFSLEQAEAMRANLGGRSNGFTIPFLNTATISETELIYPANNAQVDADNVYLFWEEVENVSYYHLSIFSAGAEVSIDELVTTNYYRSAFPAGEVYSWSVRPVNEGNYCLSSVQKRFETVADKSIFVSGITYTPPTCGVEASISFEFNDGMEPASVEWDGGQSGSEIAELSVGEHTFTVNNEEEEQIFELEIEDANDLVVSIEQDGEGVDVSIRGGKAPYTFIWSGGQEVLEPQNLDPGMHTLSIFDQNGCEVSKEVTILGVEGIILNSTCYGTDDGQIILFEPTGGEGPYTFAWNTGDDVSTVNDLVPNIYSVRIEDANGNAFIKTFEVNQADPMVTGILTDQGTATAVIVGGQEPYTITWSDGQQGEEAFDLPEGDHSYTVRDANGCELTRAFSIVINSLEDLEYVQDVQLNRNLLRSGENLELSMHLSQKADVELVIFNSLGMQLSTQKVSTSGRSLHQLPLDGLANGIYFLQVKMENDWTTKKFVIAG